MFSPKQLVIETYGVVRRFYGMNHCDCWFAIESDSDDHGGGFGSCVNNVLTSEYRGVFPITQI